MIIICENAINYDNLEEAKALIEEEHRISVNTGIKILSKFQLFGPSQIVSEEHKVYCLERMLSFIDAEMLFEYGKSIGQEVFFTCMAPLYIEWCEQIGVDYYKIRYYDRKNDGILDTTMKTQKPIFISTENSYIPCAFQFIRLWCSPKYPSVLEDYVNANLYNFSGYSDHLGNLELFKIALKEGHEYHELHVRLRDGYLEDDWSVKLKDLEAVLR